MNPHGTQRSGCPIDLTVEMLGDRWSLIIILDVMFGNRRHYRELLNLSEEGIASNILADRLKRLLEAGLLSKRGDPTHKQKAIYGLTKPGFNWSHCSHTWVRGTVGIPRYLVNSRFAQSSSKKAGGTMCEAFMTELRSIHLDVPAPRRSVFAELKPPLNGRQGGEVLPRICKHKPVYRSACPIWI